MIELARISLFMQWLGLTGAATVCYSRRWLATLSVPVAVLAAFTLLTANVLILSEAVFLLGSSLSERGISAGLFPGSHWRFLLRNTGISAIATAMLLRYFSSRTNGVCMCVPRLAPESTRCRLASGHTFSSTA